MGTKVPMAKLRQVTHERAVPTTFDRAEKVFTAGEQTRKRRTTLAENVVTWGTSHEGRSIRFAAFIPPGRYSVKQPWKNKYGQMDRFEHAILRQIVSPATNKPLHELELVFTSRTEAGKRRFFVSGLISTRCPNCRCATTQRGSTCPWASACRPLPEL